MDDETIRGLRRSLSPEVFAAVQSELGPGDAALTDNQNQNQGGLEEFARLKPDVLREVVLGPVGAGDEVMDNQNQNQGKLADLLNMKPAVLRELRVNLRGAEEVMDNQNQNQGTQGAVEASGMGKPGVLGQSGER